MTLEHNTNHVAGGLETLIHDFRRPKVQALAGSYLEGVQELEDALWALYLGSMIRGALGTSLDQLGALVEQPRENRSDDVYRVWILARALVLRSSGRTEELLRVARMVLPARVIARVVDEYPAAMTVRLEGPVPNELGVEIAELLRAAKAESVRMLVTWSESATPFRYPPSGIAELDSPRGYGTGAYAAVSS